MDEKSLLDRYRAALLNMAYQFMSNNDHENGKNSTLSHSFKSAEELCIDLLEDDGMIRRMGTTENYELTESSEKFF